MKSKEKLESIKEHIEREIPKLEELIEKNRHEHEASKMYYEGCKFELERILNKYFNNENRKSK